MDVEEAARAARAVGGGAVAPATGGGAAAPATPGAETLGAGSFTFSKGRRAREEPTFEVNKADLAVDMLGEPLRIQPWQVWLAARKLRAVEAERNFFDKIDAE